MKEKRFFLAGDDNDFMPIIPLSEGDDNDKEINVPDSIALIPLRNTVLFPGVVLPITVGRDKSIKAVNDAYKGDKLIGVVSQKDTEIEDPETKDLCKVGTIAKIIKLIKMPDGGTTIIIQGKRRFEITNVVSTEPYFVANIVKLDDVELEKDDNFKAQTETIKDIASQIIQLSPNLPTEASIILKNIESPSFLINFVSSNLNSDLAQKQSLLENNDIKSRAEKLIEILHKELQFAELKEKVSNKTRLEIDKQQRDYFLQQQLKSIKDELGGENNRVVVYQFLNEFY